MCLTLQYICLQIQGLKSFKSMKRGPASAAGASAPLASQDSLASHDSLTDTDDEEEEEMRQREAAERGEKRKQNTAGSQPSASHAGDKEEEEGLIVVPSAASISNAEVGWGPLRVAFCMHVRDGGGTGEGKRDWQQAPFLLSVAV